MIRKPENLEKTEKNIIVIIYDTKESPEKLALLISW